MKINEMGNFPAIDGHIINPHPSLIPAQLGSASLGLKCRAGAGTEIPGSIDPLTVLYLLAGLCCLVLLVVALLVGGIFLFKRRKKPASVSEDDRFSKAAKDLQGNLWYQDPATAAWYIWNDQDWRHVAGAAPRIAPPKIPPPPPSQKRGWGSCLLTLLIAGMLAVIVIGGISLIAYNFFPDYHIYSRRGDLSQILKLGGIGLLLALLGLFMLNAGFRGLLTGNAVLEDDAGRRTEKRGCGAILNDLGQLLFGLLFLAWGLGLLTVMFYQELLPWLGF